MKKILSLTAAALALLALGGCATNPMMGTHSAAQLPARAEPGGNPGGGLRAAIAGQGTSDIPGPAPTGRRILVSLMSGATTKNLSVAGCALILSIHHLNWQNHLAEAVAPTFESQVLLLVIQFAMALHRSRFSSSGVQPLILSQDFEA